MCLSTSLPRLWAPGPGVSLIHLRGPCGLPNTELGRWSAANTHCLKGGKGEGGRRGRREGRERQHHAGWSEGETRSAGRRVCCQAPERFVGVWEGQRTLARPWRCPWWGPGNLHVKAKSVLMKECRKLWTVIRNPESRADWRKRGWGRGVLARVGCGEERKASP